MKNKKYVKISISFEYQNSLGGIRAVTFLFQPFDWDWGYKGRILAGGFVLWKRYSFGPFEVRTS